MSQQSNQSFCRNNKKQPNMSKPRARQINNKKIEPGKQAGSIQTSFPRSFSPINTALPGSLNHIALASLCVNSCDFISLAFSGTESVFESAAQRCSMAMNKTTMTGPLPLCALNHISLVCRSIHDSMDFYEHVLGFVPVQRPGSFDFDGAWLFNYGIGIHLLQSENPDAMPKKTEINPKDCHISFQCESMQSVEKRLQELKVKHVKRRVEESGVYVDQIFIHDPDGYMVEMCNCENLPVIPLGGSSVCIRCPKPIHINDPNQQQQQLLASSQTCKTF